MLARCMLVAALSVVLSLTAGIDSAEAESDISPAKAVEKIRAGALVLDVRTDAEFSRGHVPDAIHIPYDELEARLPDLNWETDRQIVVYCGSGRRAAIAQDVLERHGFENVSNAGGFRTLDSALDGS